MLACRRGRGREGTTGMSTPPADRDFLWKQLEMHVALYRHYLELVLKFNAFYYAATGALLSFYLTRPDRHLLKYALIFLLLMSVVLAGFFTYAGMRQRFSRKVVVELTRQMGMTNWPEVNVLTVLLFVSAGLLVLVSIGLGVLFCRATGGPP